LGEVLRHTVSSMSEAQSEHNQSQLKLQQKYQENWIQSNNSRSHMFESFAEKAEFDRQQQERRSFVEDILSLAKSNREANELKFQQMLNLLKVPTTSESIRNFAETGLRKLVEEDLTVNGMLSSLQIPPERVQAILQIVGHSASATSGMDHAHSPSVAGPSHRK
jgi:hypothetical protein